MKAVVTVKKEWVLGIFLLIIPFLSSFILTLPVYNNFITSGDLVHVNKLGIKGNVYFAFVRSGYTKNLYEKYSLMWTYSNNIEFHPVDGSEIEEQEEELDYEADLRDNTIRSAVNVASKNAAGVNGQEIATMDKMKEIIKKSQKYYGDSFGLMVAIGLTEEWNKEDFSRNGRFKLAGTGTINQKMQVGPVGGIRYKVISAERKKMQYFFVPSSDWKSDENGLSNVEEALQVVKERNMKIQIVPVATLDEAVQFLRSLR
ncbi:S16 family serine protease [Paenibacillus radicis (ex Xue et al. 2023)]|uniref:Lon proteolytic domain-containing protein n=1 Tax=Paenibacillus radicis (ex Xue et al. 2023) TaxID=2972489 RepID=A0ABT1YTQ6_9BACL|nr:S16 family serine protease [Paenibacillus radicis (ex Xue et al. 2023)]MCR8635370.1 hypothetical protein [Paenibacillus radicis (ex Xue et al. 2023)]